MHVDGLGFRVMYSKNQGTNSRNYAKHKPNYKSIAVITDIL